MNSQSPAKKKLTIQDFTIKHILGKGAYGDVFLVLKDNQKYALKEIVKKKLSR
jgi:serine/threonine protein kinase